MVKKSAIEINKLTKSFKKVEVLKGIDLVIPEGIIFALLGPNGAGKTTLIRILSTLLSPDGGKAKVLGLDVTKQADKVRRVIGLTGQYSAIDEYLTGKENLEMMGRLYHLSAAEAKKRAEELLEQLDLVEAANRTAKTYSGGMMRRLDLAASLIATPPIIFLDEPTTGLDPRSRNVVWELVKSLAKQDVTILLTTQYLEEADQLADRIALLDKGVIIAEGTPAQLKTGIGQERLEFVVKKTTDLLRVKETFKDDSAQIDDKTKTISVATNGTVKDIQRVLAQIEKAKIDIESLNLHKPTLDDVFLKLTGHEAEERKVE